MAGSTPRSFGPAQWGLQSKLIVSMLLVGVIPLAVGLGMAFYQGSQEIREVSGESFKALATETAKKLDLLVAEEVTRTSRIVKDPLTVLALEQRRDMVQAMTEEAARAAAGEQRAKWEAKNPATVKAITDNKLAALLREYFIGSRGDPEQLVPQVVRTATKMLFITDVQGNLVAALTTLPRFAHAESAWWKGAFNKGIGQLYIEDVYFDEQAATYVFSISLPIMDSLQYEVVGVLHRIIDAKEFFSPTTHTIRFGKTGHVMLIDSRGIVMSCPILPTGVQLSDSDLIPLVTPMSPGWVTAPSDGHGHRSTSIIGFAPLPETSRATRGSIEEGGWHTFVWQSSDELFAAVKHLLTWMTVFGLVAIGLLATLGVMAARRIVMPVRQLQEAARSIGRGELKEPITIRTGDELEELAEEINRMNRQLEAAFAGLTDQVKLKTEEVQSLQQTTDQILEAVPSPILLIDHNEQVHYMNQASRVAFSNAAAGQSLPVPLFELLPLDPSGQSRLQKELKSIVTDGVRTAVATLDPDGGRAVQEPRDPLAQVQQESTAGPRELHMGPFVYRYEWFHLTGRPAERERIGLILRNMTDDSRLQEQLIQAEKSGSIGTLTAGIGHELNNPLFGILGLGEAIQDESDLSRAKMLAKDIVAHGRRMASIIRDFTGVAAREAKDQRTLVDVNEQVRQALMSVLQNFPPTTLKIEEDYRATGRLEALPEELQRVFTNVLTNAVQAMGQQGSLLIQSEDQRGTVLVTIRDSGPGIPKQYLSKVFDPFFTTRGQGEGSGLGLTIARRLVQKYNGSIRLESQEGQGATCLITFPIVESGVRREAPVRS